MAVSARHIEEREAWFRAIFTEASEATFISSSQGAMLALPLLMAALTCLLTYLWRRGTPSKGNENPRGAPRSDTPPPCRMRCSSPRRWRCWESALPLPSARRALPRPAEVPSRSFSFAACACSLKIITNQISYLKTDVAARPSYQIKSIGLESWLPK